MNKHRSVWKDLDDIARDALHFKRVSSPKRRRSLLLLQLGFLCLFGGAIPSGTDLQERELRDGPYGSEKLTDRVLLVEEETCAVRGCYGHGGCRDANCPALAQEVHLTLLHDGLGRRRSARRSVGLGNLGKHEINRYGVGEKRAKTRFSCKLTIPKCGQIMRISHLNIR